MIDLLVNFNGRIPVLVQGITGRMGRNHTRLMRAYGTNIVGGTASRPDPEIPVPVFRTCNEAVKETGAQMSILMVAPNDVLAAAKEAIDAGIRTFTTIAEGVPVHDALRLKAYAAEAGATWLGASTPGLAAPGKAKLGFLPDISLREGNFAVMSKSGTLSYEVGYRMVAAGLGQSIWIGVGGDPVKGVRFGDLVLPLLAHRETKGIILIGEVGGNEEEDFAEELRAVRGNKPVFALLAGRAAKEGVSMGHAGAIVHGGSGSLVSKEQHLRAAGVEVMQSITALVDACKAFDATVPLEAGVPKLARTSA